MPPLLGLIVLAVGFVATALVCTTLAHRFIPAEVRRANLDSLGDIFMAAIAGLYGVLVAFILSAGISRFSRTADRLVTHINEAIELKAALDESLRLRALFQSDAEGYLRELGEQDGALSAGGERLQRLDSGLARFTPQNPEETEAVKAARQRVRALTEQRRLQIIASRPTLPASVWVLLVFGGTLAVVVSALGDVRPLALQFALVAGLATLIAASLLVIRVLDDPYGAGWIFWQARVKELVRAMLQI